jgi:hypothetical protein
MIDIIEVVYRGARKGRGLVISPKDYSTKYRYVRRHLLFFGNLLFVGCLGLKFLEKILVCLGKFKFFINISLKILVFECFGINLI